VIDCTANYRPVLSSERAPYMKKERNCHSKKFKIWSSVAKGARVPVIEKKWHNRAPASVKYTITLEDGRVRPKLVDE
jgi:hypothetical protein